MKKTIAIIILLAIAMGIVLPAVQAVSVTENSENDVPFLSSSNETLASTAPPTEEGLSIEEEEITSEKAQPESGQEIPLSEYSGDSMGIGPLLTGIEEGCDPAAAPSEMPNDPGKTLFQRLLETETLDAFSSIVEEAQAEQISLFSCEEYDALEAHCCFLYTGNYPDYSPIVDQVFDIVNYSYVAPFVGAGR